MPYDGGLSQAELEQRSEQVANTIFSALTQMGNYFEKVLSWADGRTDAELSDWIIATDKNLDTKRFPLTGTAPDQHSAVLEAFVADVRALAGALNVISTGVSVGDRADIVKFA